MIPGRRKSGFGAFGRLRAPEGAAVRAMNFPLLSLIPPEPRSEPPLLGRSRGCPALLHEAAPAYRRTPSFSGLIPFDFRIGKEFPR